MFNGDFFLDCNSEPAKFNDVDHAYQYLKENNIFGVIVRKLNMD